LSLAKLIPNKLYWRRVEIKLSFLVALTTLVAFFALLFSDHGGWTFWALFVAVCRRTLNEALAHSPDLSRLAFFVPISFGLLLTLSESLRTVLGGYRWTGALKSVQRPPDPRLAALARKCGLSGCPVVFHSHLPIAFTHGVFRPRVWLSSRLVQELDDSELEAVLLHEACHQMSRDPLKVLLADSVSRALFFVPLARDLFQNYHIEKELAADRFATEKMGDPLPLARALRKLLATPVAAAPAVAMVGKPTTIEARLLALIDSRPEETSTTPHIRLGVGALWLLFLLLNLLLPESIHVASITECASSIAF